MVLHGPGIWFFKVQVFGSSRSGSVVLQGPGLWFWFQVSVPFWSVEATQQAWAEAADLMEDSVEDLMELEVVSNDNKMNSCCPSCCRLGCLLYLLN